MFNAIQNERTRLEAKEKIETPEQKQARLQQYQQNSKAIRDKFEETAKEGFTMDNITSLNSVIDKDKMFVEQDGKIYLVYKKTMKPVGKGKPINLKNKKEVLNILYSNSKILPTDQNIKTTDPNAGVGVYSLDFLNKFKIED